MHPASFRSSHDSSGWLHTHGKCRGIYVMPSSPLSTPFQGFLCASYRSSSFCPQGQLPDFVNAFRNLHVCASINFPPKDFI